MPNYISKNAINNLPLNAQDVTQINNGYLKSLLLSRNNYLKALAMNTVGTVPLSLSQKSSGEHVKLIKVGLMAIRTLDPAYSSMNIIADTESYEFTQQLKDALIIFQNLTGLPATGEVDRRTLLEIDKRLIDEIFNNAANLHIGNTSQQKKKLPLYENITTEGGIETYSIKLKADENGPQISYKNKKPLNGYIMSNFDGHYYVVLDTQSKADLKAANSEYPSDFDVVLFSSVTQLNISPNPQSIGNHQQIADNTPPKLFNDDGEKIYTIQPGDTFSNIITQNYYGTDDLAIPNEYQPGNNITVLGHNTPLSVANRSDDARFQYYMNLLYYYNSVENENGVQEWGIKLDNGHKRYTDDHLDSVNLFDNKFVASNPITAMPNYYRYLKKMEDLDDDYKINFNSSGQTTSFRTEVGQNIRIPSRKFADSLYAHLNFRRNEMLVPHTITDDEGNPTTIMEYVAEQAFDAVIDLFNNALDTITDIATEVKNDAIALYHKTLQLFKDIYNYLVDILSNWPRGFGGEYVVGGSVTWGIPIKTEIEKSRRIHRKLSKMEDLVLVYSKESVLDVGADILFGVQTGVGSKVGNGKKNKFFGVKAGGSIDSGLKGTMSTEYEFPIRQDETALLAMVINMMDTKLLNNVVDILDFFDVLNLNPKQYLTKFSVSLENNTNLKAGVTVGFSDPKAVKLNTGNKQTITQQNNQKSYGSVDNIWEKIPGLSAGIDATLSFGSSFSYEVDYGDSPLTSNGTGRVFEKITIDIKSYIGATADIDIASDIFRNLFGDFALIPEKLNILNFDQGVMLGMNYEIGRNCIPDDLQSIDLDFVVATVSGNGIEYNNTTKVNKRVTFYLGSYSGDVDTLCESGTEIKLHLSASRLYNLLFEGATVYNLDFVKNLFSKLEYRKKIGYAYNGGESQRAYRSKKKNQKSNKKKTDDKGVANDVVNSFSSADQTVDEIRYISKALAWAQNNPGAVKPFLDFGLAVNVKMEIDFQDITLDILINCFKYYLIKLYYRATMAPPVFNQLEGRLSRQTNIIQKKLSKNITVPDTQQLLNILGKKYYLELYKDGDVEYYNPNPPSGPPIIEQTTTQGLLKFIKTNNGFDTNASIVEVITEMIKGIPTQLRYLNNDISDTKGFNRKYGTVTIFDMFSFLSVLGQMEATLEAKVGATFEAFIKGGGEGLTAGLSLSGEARVLYIAKFIDKGLFVTNFYSNNDPMKTVFGSVKSSVAPGIENKRNKIKTVFNAPNNAS